MKDTLFLLQAPFLDPKLGDTPYHCPYCAHLEGMLSYHPQLRDQLEVVYVGFTRPRAAIVALLGEGQQGCPVLVVGDTARHGDDVQQAATGQYFVSDSKTIAHYLGRHYGVTVPHP
ncbi:MAG TPA: DUF3088 family protein [Burkholderiaceae bacterium]